MVRLAPALWLALLLVTFVCAGCDKASEGEAEPGGSAEEGTAAGEGGAAEGGGEAGGGEAGEGAAPAPTGPSADVVATSLGHGAAMAAEGAGRAGRADDPARILPAAVQARFAAIEDDPDPAALVRDSHYWVSNEYGQWVFEPHIRNLGGLLVGVGTDQVYLLAGWARSSLVVPLDFDRMVTRMHELYGFLFSQAATPAEFVAYWDEDNFESTQTLIAEGFADDEEAKKRYQRIHKIAREEVARRLAFVVRRFGALEIPTFLTDQEEYDFVRTLWADGRVFPVCGDLTADTAMVDVAEAATESGLDLRVLYVSNAEVYFEFGPSYRRNIAVQPYSEQSVTLRTRQLTAYGVVDGDVYHYQIQPSRNFAGWMTRHIGKTLGQLMSHRRATEVDGLSILDAEPIRNSRPPEVAAFPEWFEAPAWVQ